MSEADDDIIILTDAFEEGGESIPSELLELDHFLSQSVLLTALDQEGRRNMAEAAHYEWRSAGEEIVREGQAGDSFFLVKSGLVEVTTFDMEGKRVLLATIEPGAFFGEVAVINRKPRTATVVAAGDVELFRFDHDKLEPILRRYPDIETRMRDLILKRSEDTIRKLQV